MPKITSKSLQEAVQTLLSDPSRPALVPALDLIAVLQDLLQCRADLEAVGAGGVGPLTHPASQQPQIGYRRAIMGFGKVAVGGCKGADNQLPGIIYLDMDGEQRAPDTPCDDLFQPGTTPDPSKILACIHFSTTASVFQTIDVLHELLEDEFGIAQQPTTAQQPREPLTDEQIARWFGAATEGSLIEFARAIERAHGIVGKA